MAGEQPPGLRERKKLDTRKALSDATLWLSFERGIENVVREDIAARAGVSVRTFNNYFANKYEAIAYRQIERIQRTIEELGSRSADEPLWTAITVAVLAPLEADGVGSGPPTPGQLAEAAKFIEAAETQSALSRGVADDLLAAVAARSGTDPERDLYPRLVAGAILTAYQAATAIYVRADPPILITTLLRRALADISRGLPDPND